MDTKNIFLNKKQWLKMSEEELALFVERVFLYYREHGFPYYPTDEKFREKAYLRLKNAETSSLWDGDNIKQVMVGLNLAWSYFPHAYDIKCNNLLSPKEVFLDDDLFKKVIRKRIRMGDNISDSGIRKMLRIFTGAQGVSNFRPTVATCLYNRFAENGVVWDMSCGFGGRLLGFMVSNAQKYIGTEPSTKTFSGLCDLRDDYFDKYSLLGEMNLFNSNATKEIELIKSGSEDYLPEENSLDFCFTSPPYFDTEKYSDEDTQSYKKYPTKEKWLNGFLQKTFENCYHGLKRGKYMAINIANVKTFNNLEEATVKIAKKVGFSYERNYNYLLSSLSLQTDFKKEPIFIFKK